MTAFHCDDNHMSLAFTAFLFLVEAREVLVPQGDKCSRCYLRLNLCLIIYRPAEFVHTVVVQNRRYCARVVIVRTSADCSRAFALTSQVRVVHSAFGLCANSDTSNTSEMSHEAFVKIHCS